MTNQKKENKADKNEGFVNGLNCCGYDTFQKMMRNFLSEENILENCQKMMQDMCSGMSDNKQNK